MRYELILFHEFVQEARKKEIERRDTGKSVAELKRWQDEMEAKKLIEERKKDKKEEQILRQRVKDQIAQDRAERNARSNMYYVNDGDAKITDQAPTPRGAPAGFSSFGASSASGLAKLQFRLPDGSSHIQSFDEKANLSKVRSYLIDNRRVPFR